MYTIKEWQEQFKKGLTPVQLLRKTLDKALIAQNRYNLFITIVKAHLENEQDFIYKEAEPLAGIPYVLGDNISTKGVLTTGASNLLKNYIPVFDATVVSKLKASKAFLLGKTNLDEFGMGTTGLTSNKGMIKNPKGEDRIVGGAAAGVASAVALGLVPFGLGADTGGSLRRAAAYTGTVGFKPTYGRLSRFGLFPFAPSLDHIGCLANNVEDVALVIDVLKGKDLKDMTSLADVNVNYSKELAKPVKGKKLFYIKELLALETETEGTALILANFKKVIAQCQALGMEVTPVSLGMDLVKSLDLIYTTISCAEATTSTGNLNGLAFGERVSGLTVDDIIYNTRTKGLSEYVKGCLVLGNFVLQEANQAELLLKAYKGRRLIVNKLNDLWQDYDALILPATATIAPPIANCQELMLKPAVPLANHLVIGNLGGFPSITIPSGIALEMPIGINITGSFFKDKVVLNIAAALERNFKEQGLTRRGSADNV